MKDKINIQKELFKGVLAGIGATVGTALLYSFFNRGNGGGSV